MEGYNNKPVNIITLTVLCLLAVVPVMAQLMPPDYQPPDDWNSHYDDYGFDIDSRYCSDMYTCDGEFSFPDKLCYCDQLCGLRGDCCDGHTPVENAKIQRLADKELTFSCINRQEIVKHRSYGVSMVATCASTWTDEIMRNNCETTDEIDLLLSVPVSNLETNIMYKNMYCAYCNYEYDFKYWEVEALCNDTHNGDVDPLTCDFRFDTPNVTVSAIKCLLGEIIDECPENQENKTLITSCSSGMFSLVYDTVGTVFRNPHCAECSYLRRDEMQCEPALGTDIPIPPIDKKTYTFRLLVDFNNGHTKANDEKVTHDICAYDEMYDPISSACRAIHCIPPAVPDNGKCSLLELQQMQPTNMSGFHGNCTYTKFNFTELVFTNRSSVIIQTTGIEFDLDKVLERDGEIYICLEDSNTCNDDCVAKREILFPSDEVESWLSLIGLIISLVALAIAIIVYTVFSQLRNTPGKILLSLMSSLFCAQLMFLVADTAQGEDGWCKAVAILVHFGFLSAFCWMNIIALDLWMTFSKQFMAPGSGGKSPKRWYFYNIYGWMVPLIIVMIAVIIDNVSVPDSMTSFQPQYGTGICWFNSRTALLLYFAGPLAVFKLFDIIAFIFTSVHIIRAKRQGAMVRDKNKNTCSFLINLKLSLVMGLTWVFAFVANIANVSSLWYLFIIFNTLQGLFICLSFVCTKKVFRLVGEKYTELSSGAATQQTSLSGSKENRV